MHGDPDNLESLHNKREQESYRKATHEYIQMLLETVDKDPKSWVTLLVDGRREISNLSGWTDRIKLSGSQVRRILKRKKYSYVWAKYSLEDKQNQRKERSLEKLAKYLAIAKTDSMQMGVGRDGI